LISFSVPAQTTVRSKTVFASDVHFDAVDDFMFDKLLKLLEQEKPDVFVSGGDFFDCKIASRFVEAALGKALVDGHRVIMARVIEKIQAAITGIPEAEFTRERVLETTVCILSEETQIDLQGEMLRGVKYLNRITEALPPDAIQVFLKGNHELRADRAIDKIRHIVGGDYDPLKLALSRTARPWRVGRPYPNGNYLLNSAPLIMFQHQGRGTGKTSPKMTWNANRALGSSVCYGDSHKTGVYIGASDQTDLRDNRFSVNIGMFGNKWDDDTFGYATLQTRAIWDTSVMIADTIPGAIAIEVVKFDDPRPCPHIGAFDIVGGANA
jgi:hypothetical protein